MGIELLGKRLTAGSAVIVASQIAAFTRSQFLVRTRKAGDQLVVSNSRARPPLQHSSSRPPRCPLVALDEARVSITAEPLAQG